MLKRLTIRNYALIEALDIDFAQGLTVISGETGAGKSILLGALSLLLGNKADAGAIGHASANCVVEGEFEKDGQEYLLRRVLSPQGRSRIFVNDCPATVEELKELSAELIDIHGQFQHTLLADSRYQLTLLDSYAGLDADKAAYAEKYTLWKAQEAALKQLDGQMAAARSNQDFLEFQYNQLSQAKLRSGELEELEAEQKQLANSETISENLALAGNLLSGEQSSVIQQLREVETAAGKVAPYVESCAALKERIESARVELKDIDYELSALAGNVVFSPERLHAVDERLALLYELQRKHGVGGVDELIAKRDELGRQLEVVQDGDQERARLAAEVEALRAECERLSEALHEVRSAKASQLAASLQESVRSLEIPQAIFGVEVQQQPNLGPAGRDAVTFTFSANAGIAPKELAKCASGGEMSRIMLSLKNMMSRFVGMPSMIFDEIDTGVSGSVADKMGRMIVEMGERMQVFAITHLPQVASKGNSHFLVYKEIDPDGVTVSHIKRLEGEERVREIARMLSGSSITEEALANARVLMLGN